MVQSISFNKNAGQIFPPRGAREAGARVDFRPDIPFDNQIEWHGVRWGWQRMTLCPCKGFNDQTQQLSPTCPNCNALGWRPVPTRGYFIDPAKVGHLSEAQQAIIDRNKCMVIRGVGVSITRQPNMFAVLGNWALGSIMVTVRPENRLGYQDRLIYLDNVIPFSEILTITADDRIKLKYAAEAVNALVSDTQEFTEDDVYLDKGDLVWKPGRKPAVGTAVSINYLCHPVFVVLEYSHLLRFANFRQKPPSPKGSAMGDPMLLPIQVIARQEHLVLETGHDGGGG